MRRILVATTLALSAATQAALAEAGVEVVAHTAPARREKEKRTDIPALIDTMRHRFYPSDRKTKGEKKREASVRRRKGWC